MEFTSSLHRAATTAALAAANKSNNHHQMGTTTTTFETCFADGLDLSELLVGAVAVGATPTNGSHAAARLQQKQVEILEQQMHAQQEVRLLEAVQERTQKRSTTTIAASSVAFRNHTTSSSSSRKATTCSSMLAPINRTSISSVVVGMHSCEKREEPRHKMMRVRSTAATQKKERTRRNSATTRSVQGKNTSLLPAGKRKQQQAVRKSRKSKY